MGDSSVHGCCYGRLIIMKLMIFVGVTIFGTISGWIGAAMTHGNWFSGWSILLGGAGSLVGIWAGYKAGQYLGQ